MMMKLRTLYTSGLSKMQTRLMPLSLSLSLAKEEGNDFIMLPTVSILLLSCHLQPLPCSALQHPVSLAAPAAAPCLSSSLSPLDAPSLDPRIKTVASFPTLVT